MSEKQSLYHYKQRALGICKDFSYPKEVKEKIANAKNETEVSNIMAEARRKYL